MTGPLRISPETAIKLSKQLGVPLEHLMHMPRHILLQRMAELAAREAAEAADSAEKPEDSASNADNRSADNGPASEPGAGGQA